MEAKVLCVRTATGEQRLLSAATARSPQAMQLGGWEIVSEKMNPLEIINRAKAKKENEVSEREELVKRYTELYGKAPIPTIGNVKLKERIEQREQEIGKTVTE